jgi:normocyte-binding protein 1
MTDGEKSKVIKNFYQRDEHIYIKYMERYSQAEGLNDVDISEIIEKLGYNGKVLVKKEKKEAIYRITGELFHEILKKLDSFNKFEILIFLLECLIENRRQALSKVSQFYKKNDYEKIEIEYTVNHVLSIDRLSIELGLGLILKNYNDVSEYNSNILDDNKYYEILDSLKKLEKFRNITIELIDGKYKDKFIIFERGRLLISNSGKEKDYAPFFIDEIKNNKLEEHNQNNIRDNQIIQNLYDKFSNFFGFKIETIQKIIKELEKNLGGGYKYIFRFEDNLLELLSYWGECEEKESQKIFEYFLYNPQKDNIYDKNLNDKNRVLRKSIIKLENQYLINNFLFLSSLNLLLEDIKNRYLPDDIIKSAKLDKSYNSLNDNFEIKILNMIENEISNLWIKPNIDLVGSPGQIDILCIKNRKILIIECKNLNLKFNTKSRINSEEVDEKKKFQDKLHKKVEWVSNNKNKILEEMSENDKQKYIFEIEDYIVCGVIVRKEYSNSIFNQNLKYPIVTSNKICEFIKNI